ncbi:MAG TPA: type IV pilus modification protein PilV [Steroidobacteraceae bacterium]
MNAHRHNRRRAGGFTLVEMLVSLVITSVGLLGVAKLALGTVQANDSALMRSQATVLMQQIIENMRANRTLALSGSYDIAIGVSPAGAGVPAADLATWKGLLQSELPTGDGSVTTTQEINPATGGLETVATVTVQWDDSVAERSFGAAAGGNQALTAETML